jgi:prepilin-type N-terminal cleavage/methylation domain-containing protein
MISRFRRLLFQLIRNRLGKSTPEQRGDKRGFTLLELMIALAILGILSVLGFQAMLNNQKGARMNQFDNEVNAAMVELTRIFSDRNTCFATMHDLGPGNQTHAATVANKFNSWRKVPHIIYNANKDPGEDNNLVAYTFPADGTENGPARPFRGSKILGIKSVYLVPHDYPNYPMQLNLSENREGNAFIEITFEYTGPPETFIGLKTRTKLLPLSVRWTKRFTSSQGATETDAALHCKDLAIAEGCTPTACEGNIIPGECIDNGDLGGFDCPCSIYQDQLEHWTIDDCTAVGSSG